MGFLRAFWSVNQTKVNIQKIIVRNYILGDDWLISLKTSG